MRNQKIKNLDLGFQAKNFYSILGLYIFSLGTLVGGFSFYLFLEATGFVESKIITWNGQGLFWFLILFCFSIFLLFIPIEFLNVFKLYNSSFRDLVSNVLYVILFSLLSLVIFQFLVGAETQIFYDLKSIGRAVSFTGFIAIPLVLFAQHGLRETISFIDDASYGITLISWIVASQIFL
tara:strand:- start:470 stop:1006 length:537 start_codon:yes stop_codon:yes gene_type:complete